MTPYLVGDGADELWVAACRDDRFYVYDPHTDRFHLSRAVWLDFFAKQELRITPIDAVTARERIAGGVGSYDGRQVADLLSKHRNAGQGPDRPGRGE